MNRRTYFCSLSAIVIAGALASWHMFMPGENPYPGSIEGGYIAMTRWFAAHPDPFGWNPQQYAGLPAHRLYLPGVHYIAAALSWFAGIDPAWAYRLITAACYCLIPATFGALVHYFTRSPKWALAAAAAIAFLSPAYALSPVIKKDRGYAQAPWRLHTQAKYGEGPHNVGLAIVPLALIGVHHAATRRNRRSIAVAAFGLAAVPLVNLVAALALAFACFTLLVAGVGRRGFSLAAALAAAALAYAVACWWLTPAFIQSVAGSWAQDAHGFRLTSQQVLWVAAIAGATAVLRFGVFRRPQGMYLCFLTLTALGFGTVSLVRYGTGHDIIPESHRYAIEMEIFIILLALEIARILLALRQPWLRFAGSAPAACLLLLCLPDTWHYLMGPAERLAPLPRTGLNTWHVAQQLAALEPGGRVFNTGALRFRWNAWFDTAQATGNFDTALDNRVPVDYQYQIVSGVSSQPGQDGIDAVNELIALGVKYVTLHRPESREFYKDFRNPDKFEGLLERAWSNRGDVVYRVPFRSLAHVMRLEEMPFRHQKQYLPPFVKALTDNARPLLRTRWEGPSRLVIEGDIPEDHLLIPLVTYDKGWRGEQNGKELWIEDSWIRYLRVHAWPGKSQRIILEYTGEPDQKKYSIISAAACLAACLMLLKRHAASLEPGARG